jgi:hypothetical protein
MQQIFLSWRGGLPAEQDGGVFKPACAKWKELKETLINSRNAKETLINSVERDACVSSLRPFGKSACVKNADFKDF